ncbi:flagellar motor switch protein FliN [Turneriella parva]|uniref:Flagellar motor switch protein FliN n=1 Tax=Turneriella parva (strain ATCC BAA-1111 / DSM 21527 / NCTC 11395 / H) TaxID=869212 RepID=I4B7N7_TURPD|nr:flagellar motor switch protein FliN [Turneriella parva]AFM13294.1 flagellar motor switch protein FliN [Turneriella parva DSM 21527]
MGDGSLSQEEIDALLMGTDDMAAPAGKGGGAAVSDGGGLSPTERELLADAFNDAMQVAGSQAGAMVGKNVQITNAQVDEITPAQIAAELPKGGVIAEISMGSTQTALVFPKDIARRIAQTMMGASDEGGEINDAHLSTLSELSQSIVSSIANGLGGKFNESLSPSMPDMKLFASPADAPQFMGGIVKISYNIAVEGMPGSRMTHYIDAGSASRWAKANRSAGAPQAAAFDMDFGGAAGGGGGGMGGGVSVNPINFPSLQQGSGAAQLPPNLELLLDVQMALTVELGRTKKYVKEILSLGEGSIIELDKLAGEPVDLLVNGKLIARGEVVVIDENFGVRVTDIVGPAERMARMAGG